MDKELFVKELEARGYGVTPSSKVENGIVKEGIMIDIPGTEAKPFIKDEAIPSILGVDSGVDAIDRFIERMTREAQTMGSPLVARATRLINDEDELFSSLIPCLQKAGNDDSLLSFPVAGNLELYARVKIQESGEDMASFKLTKSMVSPETGEKVYARLMEIINSQSHFTNIKEMLMKMTGIPMDVGLPIPMYIISSSSTAMYGAAALLSDAPGQIAAIHGVDKVAVIPSSIHEAIAVPLLDGMNVDGLTALVMEVNSTVIAPEEVLSDSVYVVDAATGEINVA